MRTLSVDVGGSHVKASVLNARGRMVHDRVRVVTPPKLTPLRLVEIVGVLARELPAFDRVSVGFPGVIHDGVVLTAANLGTKRFAGFDLERALSKRLDTPVRVINDADMQGFGAIHGRGVEMVITLGTGFGTALFDNGCLAPHLELAHHNFRHDHTYEDELGEAALEAAGVKTWNRRLAKAIDSVRALVNFDHLYLGGGNSRHVHLRLPRDVTVIDNAAGILGGVKLWGDRQLGAPRPRRRARAKHEAAR